MDSMAIKNSPFMQIVVETYTLHRKSTGQDYLPEC